MSRVGKMPVAVPAGVDVTIAPELISVKGSGGQLQIAANALVTPDWLATKAVDRLVLPVGGPVFVVS